MLTKVTPLKSMHCEDLRRGKELRVKFAEIILENVGCHKQILPYTYMYTRHIAEKVSVAPSYFTGRMNKLILSHMV